MFPCWLLAPLGGAVFPVLEEEGGDACWGVWKLFEVEESICLVVGVFVVECDQVCWLEGVVQRKMFLVSE